MGLLRESGDADCDCEDGSQDLSPPTPLPGQDPPPSGHQNPREMPPSPLESTSLLSVPVRTLPPLAPTGAGTTGPSERAPTQPSTVCLICKCRQEALHQTLPTSRSSKTTSKRSHSPNASVPSLVKSRLVASSLSYKVPSQIHTSKVIKKYRKSRLRLVKRQEYKRLREMVPVLQEKDRVSKVEVIEEAIKYIDELHDALVQRFRARGLPPLLNDANLDPDNIDGGNIRDLIRRLLANNNPASLPPSRIENVRVTPSFLQKTSRNRKS